MKDEGFEGSPERLNLRDDCARGGVRIVHTVIPALDQLVDAEVAEPFLLHAADVVRVDAVVAHLDQRLERLVLVADVRQRADVVRIHAMVARLHERVDC